MRTIFNTRQTTHRVGWPLPPPHGCQGILRLDHDFRKMTKREGRCVVSNQGRRLLSERQMLWKLTDFGCFRRETDQRILQHTFSSPSAGLTEISRSGSSTVSTCASSRSVTILDSEQPHRRHPTAHVLSRQLGFPRPLMTGTQPERLQHSTY